MKTPLDPKRADGPSEPPESAASDAPAPPSRDEVESALRRLVDAVLPEPRGHRRLADEPRRLGRRR